MTFTPQGPSFGPPNQPAAGGGTKNLGFILLIAVAALGLINFLLGFCALHVDQWKQQRHR